MRVFFHLKFKKHWHIGKNVVSALYLILGLSPGIPIFNGGAPHQWPSKTKRHKTGCKIKRDSRDPISFKYRFSVKIGMFWATFLILQPVISSIGNHIISRWISGARSARVHGVTSWSGVTSRSGVMWRFIEPWSHVTPFSANSVYNGLYCICLRNMTIL